MLALLLLASCVGLSLGSRPSSMPFASTIRVEEATTLPTNSYYTLATQPAQWIDISSTGTSVPPSAYNQNVSLGFVFSFFGHQHNYVFINEAGFVTMYPQNCGGFCNWNPKSTYDRYIAPLMTDFASTQYPQSSVKYYIDKSAACLIVQWTNVTLRADAPGPFDSASAFTFQLQMFGNGTILFNYLQIPFNPETTQTKMAMTIPPYNKAPSGALATYPVVIGVGDSVTRTIGSLPPFTVKYSSAEIPVAFALNKQSIALYALPTCRNYGDCASCIAFGISSGLDCGWCSAASICTDGLGPEISEIATTCPSVSSLVFTCPGDCGPDGCVVIDDQGDTDYGAIVVGACMAVAICVSGMIVYIRKMKKEHQSFDFDAVDAEIHPSRYRKQNAGKTPVPLRSPAPQR